MNHSLSAMIVAWILISVTPCFGKPASVPEGMYIGITAPGSENGDDQGPPQRIKDQLRTRTGCNLIEAGISWKECVPNDPGEGEQVFDFSGFDKNARPVPQGWACIMKMNINDNDGEFWATKLKEKDPERYWKLAMGFWTAGAKHAGDKFGIRHYHAPGNEPSLSMNPEWHHIYAAVSNRFYDAVKAASPENQVIIGALVVGDHGHVGALYDAGCKFDIMDIHAYGGRISKWPKTSKGSPSTTAGTSPDAPRAQFVSIGQIIETHEEMVEHGDGNKKIFLGEGWSCFPLPDDVEDKRDGKDTSYTEAQIEHYRQTAIQGYRNLITPREGYDPKWVWGAKYFTMNDFWGSVHWKERAVPVMEDGKIHHWMLDGVYIKYSPTALDPFYRPWGLVDAAGKPKGDTIFNFPPYIPQVTIEGKIEDSIKKVEKEKGYRIDLTVINSEKEPITNVRFGIYALGQGWENNDILNIPFTDMGTSAPIAIEPGKTASHSFAMTIQPGFDKKEIRAYGEVFYKWQGRPYYADAWIDFEVE